MTASELQQWLLARYGNEKFTPGLERVRSFVQPQLDAIQKAQPLIITVAGTNGKGETALTLAAMARQQGVPYVLWTSPHLLSVTERFQNLAGEIGVERLWELLQQVEEDRKSWGQGLSYYEALWAAFLRWGVAQRVGLWILEVGLGGRLDAVNLLDAQAVALTSISRDHQELLGGTYRAILREKLGVVRPGARLVSALESRYLRERAQESLPAKVDWVDLFHHGALQARDDFSWRNRQLASYLWHSLGLPSTDLPSESFAGRGETWQWRGHRFVFYGSHNPDGMRKMVQFLQLGSYNEGKEFFHHIWVAFSQRPLADVKAMMSMVQGLQRPGTCVSYTRFAHPKANGGEGWWRSGDGSSPQFVHEWLDLLQGLSDQPNRSVLLLGSYYFVAAVQAHLLSLGATVLPAPRG